MSENNTRVPLILWNAATLALLLVVDAVLIGVLK